MTDLIGEERSVKDPRTGGTICFQDGVKFTRASSNPVPVVVITSLGDIPHTPGAVLSALKTVHDNLRSSVSVRGRRASS